MKSCVFRGLLGKKPLAIATASFWCVSSMGYSELLNHEQNLEAGKQFPIPVLGNGTSTMTGGFSGTLLSVFNAGAAFPFPRCLKAV